MSRKKKKTSQQVMDELQPVAETGDKLVIQYIGKRQQINKETGEFETVYREAPTKRRNGSRVIELPSSTEQRKGFTHPEAEFLLTAYPKEFKRKVAKGEK